jgi:hypothetical protein
MTYPEAYCLLRKLNAWDCACRATISQDRQRIVFYRGLQGDHSLDIGVSSPERVRAHWEGYVQNYYEARSKRIGGKT